MPTCFSAEENKITISYQSAYEECANIKKCIREILVTEEEIQLHDLVEADGDISFRYWFREKPIQNGTVFTFSDGTEIHCPIDSNCSIESFVSHDKKVANGWGTVY